MRFIDGSSDAPVGELLGSPAIGRRNCRRGWRAAEHRSPTLLANTTLCRLWWRRKRPYWRSQLAVSSRRKYRVLPIACYRTSSGRIRTKASRVEGSRLTNWDIVTKFCGEWRRATSQLSNRPSSIWSLATAKAFVSPAVCRR